MSCSNHGRTRVRGEALCALQRLADHTLTVTQARAPRVSALVLLLDLDDLSHSAVGSDIPAVHAAALLEHYARRLREMEGSL